MCKEDHVDTGRRRFLTFMTTTLSGIGAAFTALPFISAWWPSARAQAAGAPVEADISHLNPGQMLTVEWRGKPVWVIRRDENILQELNHLNSSLRDPDSLVEQQPEYAKNVYRSRNPEYLVLVGICTHLGCSPKYKPVVGDLSSDWPGGFYCPCHGSKFDMAGRVFKGVPAPINMEVPPYRFSDEKTIVIGENNEVA